MSDKMFPLKFDNMLNWIFTEYKNHKTIFGIPIQKFFNSNGDYSLDLLDEKISNPIGPAAGPHTQLTQNIITAYLSGGRFFELKTIQKMDELVIDKPCIDARDECYNVEWSQELKLDQSYNEYVKAWFILHLLNILFNHEKPGEKDFIFNMSVGYDLAGIKTKRMNRFIDELIDASGTKEFINCKKSMLDFLKKENNKKIITHNSNLTNDKYNSLISAIENISFNISNSVTLSTMHGCPPNEIEAISKYLIETKGLHTYVKLNPTLLGFETVQNILTSLGFHHIILKEESFSHDLQYTDAVPMLKRLKTFAKNHNIIFGVKLSNTLGVANTQKMLVGADMYMSGRSLFPLTINLAYKLASEFNGDLNISYSGGATEYNTKDILECGIRPITYATDLLKPGGYQRLFQISLDIANSIHSLDKEYNINLIKLKKLAEASLADKHYMKEKRKINSIKVTKELDAFDCFISPCQEACPINQDVSEYVRLVGEERFTEAFELIVSKNALPHITGYICDHQCMYHCTRWDYDDPVQIRELKKKAAIEGYNEYINKFNTEFNIARHDTQAAVIGAGPSGLAASFFLAKSGFDVTLFEHEMRPGGIVQNVLPNFRLPQEAIDKDIKFIESLGIRFVFGVDYNFSIERLKEEGFKYIYLATGAGKSNEINLDTDSKNVFDAIEFLREFKNNNEPDLGKNVAVVGGGNSAMDSARAAMKCDGVENVYIIYRRTQEFMPADKEEFYAALEDGIIFKQLLLPVSLKNGILTCQKMILDDLENDGRRNVTPIPGQFEKIKIDSLISAIGEKVDTDIFQANEIRFAGNNLIVIPGTNETSIENVFVGGDALRGPSTVVESIADGRTAANAIIAKENIEPLHDVDAGRYFNSKKRETDIITRKGLIITHNLLDPVAEAHRCLDCNFICTKCVEVCPNRANIAIDTSKLDNIFEDRYQILHLDQACNECGNCETFCPHSGAPYKDKITLFMSEVEFLESRNEGFYFLPNEQDQVINVKVRFNSNIGELKIHNDDVIENNFNETINITKLGALIKEVYVNYNYLLESTAE